MQVDHEVGHTHHGHHLFEELHIGLVVTLREVAHGSVVLHEDVDALVDGTVLYDGVVGLCNGQQVAEAFLEEVDLQVERPAVDVAVVVFQIRVMLYGLEAWLPAVVLGKHACQRRLAAPDISCYCNVHVM